jgi:hypothetical protein
VRDLWLSKDQVIAITELERAHVAREGRSRRVDRAASKKTGRNGKAVPEYSAASLPAEFHQKILALELEHSRAGVLQLPQKNR